MSSVKATVGLPQKLSQAIMTFLTRPMAILTNTDYQPAVV